MVYLGTTMVFRCCWLVCLALNGWWLWGAQTPANAWGNTALLPPIVSTQSIPGLIGQAKDRGYDSVMLSLEADPGALAAAAEAGHAKNLRVIGLIDFRDSPKLAAAWLAKPWSQRESDDLSAAIVQICQKASLDALVFIHPNLDFAWRELDAEGREGFYGRGNPNLLELPEWLKGWARRFLTKLQIRVQTAVPGIVVGKISDPSPVQNQSTAPAALATAPEWRTLPKRDFLQGFIRDEQGRGLANAQVSLRDAYGGLLSSTYTDGLGWFGLVRDAQARKTKINIDYPGLPTASFNLTRVQASDAGKLPEWVLPGSADLAALPWLSFIRPTSLPSQANLVNLIGRTTPGNRVYRLIQANPADPGSAETQAEIPVLSSGAFFQDKVNMDLDGRRIRLKLVDPRGKIALFSLPAKTENTAAANETAEDPPLWMVKSPAEDQLFLSGDALELRLAGPSGWNLAAHCFKGKHKIDMEEFPSPETAGRSEYLARFTLPAGSRLAAAKVLFVGSKPKTRQSLRLWSPGEVALRNRQDPLVAVALNPDTAVKWGRHQVRLDGPYAAEVPAGTRFLVTGRIGSSYKVRLSRSLDAWVYAEDLKLLPENTPQPHGYFTFCQASGTDQGDRVWIPTSAQIPYSLTPVYDEHKGWRLLVDFYNSHMAVTWFSHLESRKLIGFISGEQIEEDHFRLTIPIAGKELWGYSMESIKGGLALTIRYPPAIQAKPLAGMVIALDPGHGGDALGGVGYLGTAEKTINTWFCADLAQALAERGAKAVILRTEDINIPFDQRLARALQAKASLILSIHANAGDMSGGLTSLAGPSVYYKFDYSRSAAQFIYQELVDFSKKGDGLVGNFNFNLLRKTSLPDVLVETGYLTNPVEEAQLLNPQYRRQEAAAIVRGLENWLETAR